MTKPGGRLISDLHASLGPALVPASPNPGGGQRGWQARASSQSTRPISWETAGGPHSEAGYTRLKDHSCLPGAILGIQSHGKSPRFNRNCPKGMYVADRNGREGAMGTC